MIKNYAELCDNEKESLIDFVLLNSEDKFEREVLKERYESDEFFFGKGIIMKFEGDEIRWKASMILKEVGYKDIGYVAEYLVKKESSNKKLYLNEMIMHIRALANEYGLKKILFGSRDEKVIGILSEEGYCYLYRGIRMALNEYNTRYPLLTLIPLSHENMGEYLTVYNDSFSDVPNGATLTETEAQAYVDENLSNEKYFLVNDGQNIIGFVQFSIDDSAGEFDLGLITEFHGRGLGKRLLETAINFLIEKNVESIELTVISGNTIALEMYKKRGFIEKKHLGCWYDISK